MKIKIVWALALLLFIYSGIMTYKSVTSKSMITLLKDTNYYSVHCLQPAINLDSDTFKLCKSLQKLLPKDKDLRLSFHPSECKEFSKKLIMAIKKVESNMDKDAISNKDALGLMQIMYESAKDVGFTGTPEELMDPITNTKYGCLYLAKLYKEKKDMNKALDAYNRGSKAETNNPYLGNWKDHPYVGKILSKRQG